MRQKAQFIMIPIIAAEQIEWAESYIGKKGWPLERIVNMIFEVATDHHIDNGTWDKDRYSMPYDPDQAKPVIREVLEELIAKREGLQDKIIGIEHRLRNEPLTTMKRIVLLEEQIGLLRELNKKLRAIT